VRIGAGGDARDYFAIELFGDCDRATVTALGAELIAA
jgi:hypothetical protein